MFSATNANGAKKRFVARLRKQLHPRINNNINIINLMLTIIIIIILIYNNKYNIINNNKIIVIKLILRIIITVIIIIMRLPKILTGEATLIHKFRTTQEKQ